MGINGKQSEAEGLVLGGDLGQLLLGVGIELAVLNAPPDIVALGDEARFLGVFMVVDLVDAVAPQQVELAGEFHVGAHHHSLVISLLMKHIPEHMGGGQGAGHIIGVVAAKGQQQGDAAGLGHHTGGGPAGAGHGAPAPQALGIGEADVLLGELVQLRDDAMVQAAALLFGGEGGFHGLQVEINKIPLFLREGDLGFLRGDIFLLDEGGALSDGIEPLGKPHNIDGPPDPQKAEYDAQGKVDAGADGRKGDGFAQQTKPQMVTAAVAAPERQPHRADQGHAHDALEEAFDDGAFYPVDSGQQGKQNGIEAHVAVEIGVPLGGKIAKAAKQKQQRSQNGHR